MVVGCQPFRYVITVFRFRRSSEMLNNRILRSKYYLLYKSILLLYVYGPLMETVWSIHGTLLLLMNGPITKLNTIFFFRRVVDELELRNWFK